MSLFLYIIRLTIFSKSCLYMYFDDMTVSLYTEKQNQIVSVSDPFNNNDNSTNSVSVKLVLEGKVLQYVQFRDGIRLSELQVFIHKLREIKFVHYPALFRRLNVIELYQSLHFYHVKMCRARQFFGDGRITVLQMYVFQ